jgi:hypothetical protein
MGASCHWGTHWGDGLTQGTDATMSKSSEKPTAPRRSRKGPLWVVLGVVMVAGKASASANLLSGAFHHPRDMFVLLPIMALLSLLGRKPVGMALFLAPLVALVIDPSSPLIGIGIAFGAFLVLLAACVAIGTLLRLGEHPHSSGT